MMEEKRSHELAIKWLKGTITEKEKLEFALWYNSHDDENLYSAVEDETILKDRMFNHVTANTQQLEKRSSAGMKNNWRWKLGVAASLFILFSVSFYRSFNGRENLIVSEHKAPTLTIADGQAIELRVDQKGIVVGSEIKYMNGQAVASFSKNEVHKLRLTTPKGLIYLITLPDDSRVTLNAGSTLIYPSSFASNERLVELEGEAFFEVSKLNSNIAVDVAASKETRRSFQRIPFKVKTSGQIIEVLGTKFNVSAYKTDQVTQTTLIEGAVSLSANNTENGVNKHTVLLSPGQQALYGQNGFSVRSVDTEPYTAWKEGYFYFEDASVPLVMAQMKHWYDFELSYESSIPDKVFSGKIPRNISLREAINILNKAGINVRLISDNQLLISSSSYKINK